MPFSNRSSDPVSHFWLRMVVLFVVFVAAMGALISVVAGNGVLVPPAPPAPATSSPGPSVALVVPSDWYIPPTLPPSSAAPSGSINPSQIPGSPSTVSVRLPDSLGVTAGTDGSRYGDTWSFEAVLPVDYTLDATVTCRWTMQLSDGRTVSTAGLATDDFCGPWQVTVPYVVATGPSDYPAVVILDMSGLDATGRTIQVTSSPYKAQPLDGNTSTSFSASNLPLLWLDGSPSFDPNGQAQMHLHWLSTAGAVDGLAALPASLAIAPITDQDYTISNGGSVAPDGVGVITVKAHDPSIAASTLVAKISVVQTGS